MIIIKTTLLKLKLTFLFCQFLLLSSFAISQNQSIVDMEFLTIESGAESFGKNALSYIKNQKDDLTEGLPEKIVEEARLRESKEYPEICFAIGDYFFERKEMQKAYEYLYTSFKVGLAAGEAPQNYHGQFHKSFGFVLAYFERPEEAIHHLNKSLTFNTLSVSEQIKVHNHLGLIYVKREDFDNAEREYREGYELANINNHEDWRGVLAGNLGYIAYRKNDFGRAQELLKLDYKLSKENSQHNSQVIALALLIKMEIIQNGTDNIEPKVEELNSLMDSIESLGTKKNYYDFLQFYYQEIGDYKNALKNYKQFQEMSDSIARNKDILSIEKFRFQIEFEKTQSELTVLNEKRKQDSFKLYSLIFVFAIFIIASIIIVRLLIKRRQQEREVLMLQKAKMKDELVNSENELQLLLSKLIEKSNLADNLKNKIDSINSDKDSIKIIDSLESFTLLTEEDWTSFKKLFGKLNPGFFTFLKKEHPEITPAETRFITLICLNLSNTEMANALGISPDSVRKTSLRLRKKLNIGSHEELVKFILELENFNH